MKDLALVFGGSSGLGLSLVEYLSSLDFLVTSVSRADTTGFGQCNSHINLDLSETTISSFEQLLNNNPPYRYIFFAQRYRPSSVSSCLDEYRTMVISVANFLQAIISSPLYHSCSPQSRVRIAVVGSTYAQSVGFDQDWSYHTCKAAQLSLVRYFALNSHRKFSINLISPATYKKANTEKFWNSSEKSTLWNSYPSSGLLSVQDVAHSIVDFVLSSPFISGQNLDLDFGLSNLYHDQKVI